MNNHKKNKPLIIIDGYGFIFRAYHIQPSLTSPSGIPVGALYGFASMLLKIIKDFDFQHAVIVLDSAGKNFRHEVYSDYKANRPKAAEDLVIQLKLIPKVAEALNFTTFAKVGFEADDIIATLASKATEAKQDAIIISSDKDLMQLINDHIKMYDPVKAKYINDEDVIAKFGVEPERVADVQALIGDKSDNIPGIAGIGVKGAAKLINEFDDLENLLASIGKIENKRLRELLSNDKDNALMSKKLVSLDKDVDIHYDINNLTWDSPGTDKVSFLFDEFGFKSLKSRAENLFHIKIKDSILNSQKKVKSDNIKISEIKDQESFNSLYHQIKSVGIVAVQLSQETDNITNGRDLFLSIRYIVYVIHYPKSFDIDMLFEDISIKKITYNLKMILKYFDCRCLAFEDLQLMEYCITSGKKQRSLFEIIKHYDDTKNDSYFPIPTEITVDFTSCYNILEQELFKNKLLFLYKDIDLPICYILHDMEKEGIEINTKYLNDLSNEFEKKIAELEESIYEISGEKFNIASPKQLAEMLFTKMKLPFAKKLAKSQTYSTNADILEKLSSEGYEIADILLYYRQLTKLKNTYTDTLPLQTDQKGRVHTTFLQNATSTGRLSSHNPNVQNIPIRTAEGNRIRAAFVAKERYDLISADYSQIELRILSYIANIDSLKDAFVKGKDIHTETAMQIFSVSEDQMTPELRRKSKAINFGIIYGISAFGLARRINVTREEGKNYIDKYFQKFPGIKEYMERTIAFAREHEYVENMLGRKIFIPEINSKNGTLRSFAERAAINAPIQSLASDIVKIAMVQVEKELKQHNLKTKMLLQIHDELIFECSKDETIKVMKVIKDTMQKQSLVNIPMIVSIKYGSNWQEMSLHSI